MSGIMSIFKQALGVSGKKISRSVAKDRLSLMLVHQRNSDVVQNIDMDALQKDVAEVIAKYVKVASTSSSNNVGLKRDGDCDFLEMHFQLDQNSLNNEQARLNVSMPR